MRTPFKPYKNADLFFPKSSTSQYSNRTMDTYGNPSTLSSLNEDLLLVEAYLVAMPGWKSSEGKLFEGTEKGSGERVRGGGIENYLSFYGYVISPLELPPELGVSVINGTAKIQVRQNLINEGTFKLLSVYQPPAVIPYKASRIITRINGIFTWQ